MTAGRDHDENRGLFSGMIELRDLNRIRECVICVGTTGSGKSSTVSRFTGRRAPSSAGFERQTEECAIYEPLDGSGPVWVDTVGFEDSGFDDELSFQETLRFLKHSGISRIAAIVWNIIPNVRRDSVLMKQAKYIDLFYPGEIWRNVIIVCKQSMKPELDGGGAQKAAEAFASDGVLPQIVGYRFLTDLDEYQRSRLERDPESRQAFNIVTNEEVRGILASSLSRCGPPVELVFQDQKCLDCGTIEDPRLMPIYCHMEKQLVHTSRVGIIHPMPIEHYHPTEVQIAEHPGHAEYPWYGGCMLDMVPKRYTCCKRKIGKPGCVLKWSCCRRLVHPVSSEESQGCRRRYPCCGADPDDHRRSLNREDGCEARFLCCNGHTDSQGCFEVCKKCGKAWGTSAETNRCFRKPHNIVEHWEELEEEEDLGGFPDEETHLTIKTKSNGEETNNNSDKKIKTVFGLPPIVLSKPF